MPIEKITADDLRDMEHQEGLVLQGCGGEAWEWLDGIGVGSMLSGMFSSFKISLSQQRSLMLKSMVLDALE